MSPNAGRGVARLLLGAALLAPAFDTAEAQVLGGGAIGARSPAVFGGARRDQPGVDNVSGTADLVGGYDTNILADNAGLGGGTGGELGSSERTDSTFAGGSIGMQWNRNRQRVAYFGSVGASYRTFFDVDKFDAQSYDAGGGVGFQISARSSVSLNGNVGVQPFYQFGVLNGSGTGLAPDPGDGPLFTPDYQSAREQVLRFGGQVAYVYQISPRTSFSADVMRSGFHPLNNDAEQAGMQDLGATAASARITRQLTTNLGARMGYGYTQYDRVDTRPLLPADVGQETVAVHNIDVGLNYQRALTVARRTSFSFGTGSNITSRADANTSTAGQRTEFNVSGFASLQRDFLRTWSASLNYNRGTSYVEGYNEFVVFDSARANIQGLFTDRLDASAGLGYTNGSMQSVRGERIANLSAGARLRYGITESMAAFVAYTYAWYDVPTTLQPTGVIGGYQPSRQGVRVGLTVWFDLLH